MSIKRLKIVYLRKIHKSLLKFKLMIETIKTFKKICSLPHKYKQFLEKNTQTILVILGHLGHFGVFFFLGYFGVFEFILVILESSRLFGHFRGSRSILVIFTFQDIVISRVF